MVVRKSRSWVIVRPSPPPEPIKLSPLDQGNFPISVLLLYRHPIKDAADTIKMALSQALVHYYPFCGRIVSGADADGGSRYIEFNGDGGGAVEFIAASADCSLQAAKLLEPLPSSGGGTAVARPSPLDELAMSYPFGSYGASDPLLTVQVTEFACGGFVVGITRSHAVTDGVGIAQFLGAVGELARGLPSSSVPPVRCDEAVSTLPPPPTDAAITSLLLASGGLGEPLPLVFLDIAIPSSFIDRVKAEFSAASTSTSSCRCTMFEVVVSALWQCRTRAIMSSGSSRPDTLSFLKFPVNVRKHVGAKDGYYGNCVVHKLVVATSSTVASLGMVELVSMIRRAKDDDGQQVADHLLMQLNKKDDYLQPQDGGYSLMSVSSWRNIGFEKVDFGSGQPARVIWPGVPPLPLCVACLPCGERDGANVLSYLVKEEHAQAFLAEIAKLA